MAQIQSWVTILGGAGLHFLHTEVPTLRDILRKRLLIQEKKMLVEGGGRKNYSVREMIEEQLTAIYAQWAKSNVKFKPPVVAERKPLVNKLIKAWDKVTDIALKKETKANVVSIWESKLEDSDQPPCKEDCTKQAHIDCSCEDAQKVPVLDLAWLKGQREKTGSKSKYQIKNADVKETEKQINTAKRK